MLVVENASEVRLRGYSYVVLPDSFVSPITYVFKICFQLLGHSQLNTETRQLHVLASELLGNSEK